MQYRAFVDQVRRRALLDVKAEAEKAIGATLETLGERIVPGEADELASHLPPEIGRHLREVEGEEAFDLEGFYGRVARREGVALEDATYHARTVISVLHQAVPASAMAHLRAILPDTFGHLFAFVGKGGPETGSATAQDDYW
jgi:uncharacterized protein (DUF2267 family)